MINIQPSNPTLFLRRCYINLRWSCLNLRSSSKYQIRVFEIKLQAAVLEKNWWCCQARGSKLVQALRLPWQNSLSSSPPEFTCRPMDGNRLKMRLALRCQIKGETSSKIGDDQTKWWTRKCVYCTPVRVHSSPDNECNQGDIWDGNWILTKSNELLLEI